MNDQNTVFYWNEYLLVLYFLPAALSRLNWMCWLGTRRDKCSCCPNSCI